MQMVAGHSQSSNGSKQRFPQIHDLCYGAGEQLPACDHACLCSGHRAGTELGLPVPLAACIALHGFVA